MFQKNLSREEAEDIISKAEKILLKNTLPFGYRLSDLGGYTRIDVKHAFLLSTAKMCEQFGKYDENNDELVSYIKALDTCAINIGFGGIPDAELAEIKNLDSQLEYLDLARKWSLISHESDKEKEGGDVVLYRMREKFMACEMATSFARYCHQLLITGDLEYWQKVYERIGLEYPYIDKVMKEKEAKGCLIGILMIIILAITIITI